MFNTWIVSHSAILYQPVLSIKKMSTVNPLLRPPGAYLFQTPFKKGLIETRGLFNLEMMMVSVLHKELEYKVKKLKCKKLEVMQARI